MRSLLAVLLACLSAAAQTNSTNLVKPKEDKLAAAREKQVRDYFARLHEIPGIRVIEGDYYDMTEIVKALDSVINGRKRSVFSLPKNIKQHLVYGEVLQVVDNGLLVKDSLSKQTIFLVNNHQQKTVIDGSEIAAVAAVTGRHTYRNTLGAATTILKMDCGKPMNSNDKPDLIIRVTELRNFEIRRPKDGKPALAGDKAI